MDSGNNPLTDLTFKGPVSGESRYVIYPTALDSAIQLCIIAPTNGRLPVHTHTRILNKHHPTHVYMASDGGQGE